MARGAWEQTMARVGSAVLCGAAERGAPVTGGPCLCKTPVLRMRLCSGDTYAVDAGELIRLLHSTAVKGRLILALLFSSLGVLFCYRSGRLLWSGGTELSAQISERACMSGRIRACLHVWKDEHARRPLRLDRKRPGWQRAPTLSACTTAQLSFPESGAG